MRSVIQVFPGRNDDHGPFEQCKPLRCRLLPQILKRLRDCIRERRYVATLHAEEEMNNDELSIFDVERVILTGEIVERQKDKETGEWKYLVRGLTLEEMDAVVVTTGSNR